MFASPPAAPINPKPARGRRGRPGRVTGPLAVGLAAALLASCGPHHASPGTAAAQQAFLGQVHNSDPGIDGSRSNVQLVRLGNAACTVFSAGLSYQSVANQIGAENTDLSSNVLGDVITAAAEHLCPKYAGRVQ